MQARKAIHPLLLEPNYWRNRLQEITLRRPSTMMLPRPDLSGGGKDVVEFRIKAHDGEPLWGLLARPTWREGLRPARVRAVGPAHAPAIDRAWVEEGGAELVLQEPAGRRLEDRVLDVLRVWQFATATQGIDPQRVALGTTDAREADEFLIARELVSGPLAAQ